MITFAPKGYRLACCTMGPGGPLSQRSGWLSLQAGWKDGKTAHTVRSRFGTDARELTRSPFFAVWLLVNKQIILLHLLNFRVPTPFDFPGSPAAINCS